MSDFLSFIVELIRFFHGAIQLCFVSVSWIAFITQNLLLVLWCSHFDAWNEIRPVRGSCSSFTCLMEECGHNCCEHVNGLVTRVKQK